MPGADSTLRSVPKRDAGTCKIDRSADDLRIVFENDSNHLRSIRTAVEDFCRAGGFESDACEEIGFVVNEAVANVMRHAYHSIGHQPIDLNAVLAGDGVSIDIRDWGLGNLPAEKCCNSGKSDDIPEPGGLGLVCMRRLMDDVQFVPQQPGMILRMTRRRKR